VRGEAVGVGERRSEGTAVESLEDLFRLQYKPMVRLAALLLGADAVAEEVVQECFIRVGRRWDRVHHPTAYLRAAVVNGCRSQRRRSSVERRYATTKAPNESAQLGADEVWDALAGLTYRQRAAVVLRYYADLPDEDIADALGCRPATVRSLVHRGLAQLREVIEP
jgi:RNA polymerase sigma-70 factor (sigma-E family)